MLKERTSSASQLRAENALRRNNRNLRAKVRSILPQEMCLRGRRPDRHIHSSAALRRPHSSMHIQVSVSKLMMKEFDKLTTNELQEINSNKHYFLGDDKAIAYYERYLEHNHPEFKLQRLAVSQSAEANPNTSLLFVPFNLATQKLSRSSSKLSIHSLHKLEQKRDSSASLFAQRPKTSFKVADPLQIVQNNKVRYHECLNRKQDIDQEQKVRREINMANLQKQQHIAVVNRDTLQKQKIASLKTRQMHSLFQSNNHKNHNKQLLEQYEVATLTNKLRKICLKRKEKEQDRPDINA